MIPVLVQPALALVLEQLEIDDPPDLVLLLRDLARTHRHCIAVDLPSGIESDDGTPLNEGLPHSDLTIALGAWKFAHFLNPASTMMGAKRLVPIGVGEVEGAAQRLGKPSLHAPASDAHKYSRGLLAVVGGEMPGAAILAASAAMRAGAGYVKLLADHPPAFAPPELVTDTAPLPEALADQRIAAILAGPGLGRSEGAKQRLIAALAARRPSVLDADALVLLAPDMLPGDVPAIATPHEGELEALCRAFAVVAGTKRERAASLARTSGMVVVAKGPDTIVAAPDGALFLADPASSWLSTAGTGDVLAGIIASRLATGASPVQAACQGVWLHGEAARLAGPAFTAGDLARAVPAALALSLAALWKLPAVFIVENNEYSMGTPLERTLPVRDITLKASGYGMYCDRFEANDVFEVRDKLKKACEHARSGKGPALIEILTYRFRGHSMSDPGKYRTPEEVELRKKKDPVRVARQLLLDRGVSTQDVEALDAAVEEEVRDAVQFAEESASPSEELLRELVYAPSAEGVLADSARARTIADNIVGGG